MKSICYLVPYFGKLPQSTPMWLLSCKLNPTVNWLIMTDDKTEYDYPENVKVIYCTFEEITQRIREHFDFEVMIDKPWRLCVFRPCYGEVFKKELEGYDFWGHCDMDLIWGDIRKYLTDEVLEKYDKIGFQGHSTLYRNTPENNARYKNNFDGVFNYRDAFSGKVKCCFDEGAMCNIYENLGVEYFHEVNFAHLSVWANSFFVDKLPQEDNYKNKHQVFVWDQGHLYRVYAHDGALHKDEFMYVHTFMRPVDYRIDRYDENELYVLYPDVVRRLKREALTYRFVMRKGHCTAVHYYTKLAYANRHKLTPEKVWKNFKKKVEIVAGGRFKQ